MVMLIIDKTLNLEGDFVELHGSTIKIQLDLSQDMQYSYFRKIDHVEVKMVYQDSEKEWENFQFLFDLTVWISIIAC